MGTRGEVTEEDSTEWTGAEVVEEALDCPAEGEEETEEDGAR